MSGSGFGNKTRKVGAGISVKDAGAGSTGGEGGVFRVGGTKVVAPTFGEMGAPVVHGRNQLLHVNRALFR